jgi:ferredoxin/flavodoxin
MTERVARILIAYLSPAGSTARVAHVIQRAGEALGAEVDLLDLSRRPDPQNLAARFGAAAGHCLLCVGSPVYAAHPVPPVMDFIDRLPKAGNVYAVPFVTWGQVSSGVALAEMADALTSRGYPVIGAAKIVALHSLMWTSADPLGQSHPDSEDEQAVETLVQAAIAKLKAARPESLPAGALAYQPEELARQMAARTFEVAKANYPRRDVDPERCTECGLCAEQCPTAAISLSPRPEFGPACIYCFNCVRLCPEAAIDADLEPIRAFIRKRAEQLGERPLTRVFV